MFPQSHLCFSLSTHSASQSVHKACAGHHTRWSWRLTVDQTTVIFSRHTYSGESVCALCVDRFDKELKYVDSS